MRDWMVDGLRGNIRVGNSDLFWHDTWFGTAPLKEVFPRLFGISSLYDDPVSNFGKWVNGVWTWEFKWRRNCFVWEEDLHLEFRNALLVISSRSPCRKERIYGAGFYIL